MPLSPMEWFFGKEAALPGGQRRPSGRHGGIVILADVSASLSQDTLKTALLDVYREVPSARVFVFAGIAAPVDMRTLEWFPDVKAGGTDMTQGLALVAPLRPDHTFILSDGVCETEESHDRSLVMADEMTGAISSLWVQSCFDAVEMSPKGEWGREFKRRLARRGGRVREVGYYDGADVISTAILEITRTAHLHHRVEVHHHHGLPPEHIDHGRQGMAFSSTAPRVRRRQP